MANKYRYVDIDLDRPRKLRFDMNALCELEDTFDKPIVEVLKEINDGVSIKRIRILLKIGLMHEDAELTKEQVGYMVDVDNILEVQAKLTEALTIGQSGKNAKRPVPKEANQSGTGTK